MEVLYPECCQCTYHQVHSTTEGLFCWLCAAAIADLSASVLALLHFLGNTRKLRCTTAIGARIDLHQQDGMELSFGTSIAGDRSLLSTHGGHILTVVFCPLFLCLMAPNPNVRLPGYLLILLNYGYNFLHSLRDLEH